MTDVLKVYHGTSFENLASILKEGVRPPSFWTYKHQAMLTYAGIGEMQGYGGAVIAVHVGDRRWHEMNKQNFNFLPIEGTAHEAYCIMESNGIGIVCLDHISPDAIEVAYTSEPDLSKRRIKRS
ncbi:hypothetical protein [Aeromonas allosaccharophila]